MGKTPSYTLKANKNYRDKFDFVQVKFDKSLDIRRRFAENGISSASEYIVNLVLADLSGARKESQETAFNNNILQAGQEEHPTPNPPKTEKQKRESLIEMQAQLEKMRREDEQKRREIIAEEMAREIAELREKPKEPEELPEPVPYFDIAGNPIEDPREYLVKKERARAKKLQDAIDAAHGVQTVDAPAMLTDKEG